VSWPYVLLPVVGAPVAPGWLASFAPLALWGPVAEPGPAIFAVVQVQRHAVLLAPPLPLPLAADRGAGWRRVLRQHGGQALEQAAFVRIAQGHLHLPALDSDVAIDRCRGFGQGLC
jgi:hypothetical protein